LIITIIIGGIVGAIAKVIIPGRDPGGIIVTALLGIVGSVVATYLGQISGWLQPGQAAGFIGAVLGAALVLGIYRLVTMWRTPAATRR
jgi:uncharacterized membrane protein YeaQ/YmgE (transglycosylase-associated protein family)